MGNSPSAMALGRGGSKDLTGRASPFRLVCLPLLVLLLFGGCHETSPPLEFAVGVFQDERLPAVGEQDLDEILSEARRMLRVKLGELPLEFKVVRRGTLAQLFEEARSESEELVRWQQNHPPLLSLHESEWLAQLKKAEPQMVAFLKGQWSLKQLAAYGAAQSYGEFVARLRVEYLKKLKTLKNYRLKNGAPLFGADARLHSYRHWVEMMKRQRHYDLIITNTILAYDTVEQPYPHVIYKHGKVSGSSFESPRRRGYLAASSSMATVFELYAQEPYFTGERTAKAGQLSRSEINKALGGYLLAHELGHQIYWIPDVYDHPPGCLMDTRFENMEIGDGYRQLRQSDKICPRCQPYVVSRHTIMTGQQQLMGGDGTARTRLDRELEHFPRPVDRDLNEVRAFFHNLR